jgi:hypothetical protein
MIKSRKNIKKQRDFTAKTSKSKNVLIKPGVCEHFSGLRIEPGQRYFHEPEEPVVMEMPSYGAKIRHVFADTFFAEHFLQ